MNLTNYLLIAILYILVAQFYPSTFDTLIPIAIFAFVVYGCYWLTRLPGRWKKHRAKQKQEKQDEDEYWDYQKQHEAIRAKYDPESKWNEATSLPTSYRDEIQELNWKYREMLQRRNEWTVSDFH